MDLTNYEKVILLGVLDMHLEGMADAREDMIDDKATLNTLEEFSSTLQQHDIDVEIVEGIKRKVLEDARG